MDADEPGEGRVARVPSGERRRGRMGWAWVGWEACESYRCETGPNRVRKLVPAAVGVDMGGRVDAWDGGAVLWYG